MLSAEDAERAKRLEQAHLEPPEPEPIGQHEINAMLAEVLEDIGIGSVIADCPDIKAMLKDYYRAEVIAALVDEYGVREEDIPYDDE